MVHVTTELWFLRSTMDKITRFLLSVRLKPSGSVNKGVRAQQRAFTEAQGSREVDDEM